MSVPPFWGISRDSCAGFSAFVALDTAPSTAGLVAEARTRRSRTPSRREFVTALLTSGSFLACAFAFALSSDSARTLHPLRAAGLVLGLAVLSQVEFELGLARSCPHSFCSSRCSFCCRSISCPWRCARAMRSAAYSISLPAGCARSVPLRWPAVPGSPSHRRWCCSWQASARPHGRTGRSTSVRLPLRWPATSSTRRCTNTSPTACRCGR